MSSIDNLFENAAKLVNTLTEKPTNEELLSLYGLYKQGNFGDNMNEAPGFFNFKEKEKWNSWNKCKGKSKEEAKKEYVNYVATLLKKYPRK